MALHKAVRCQLLRVIHTQTSRRQTPPASDSLLGMELASLMYVANEPESEIVCQLLRASDIKCMSRITNMGFGSGGEMPLSGGGVREILVRPEDVDAARAVLAEAQSGA